MINQTLIDLWRIIRGDSPLIVNIPHCGTHVPPDMAGGLSEAAQSLPDTDWHVEKLYGFAPRLGATLMYATHSRYVADLNRDPSGEPIYPGADNTEVCPLRTFRNQALWRAGCEPGAAEVAQRVETFWRPYHAQLAAQIEGLKRRHGFAVLLDGHSILSELPRFFSGVLPDLNLGTAEGRSCDGALERRAGEVIASVPGLSHIVNGRFKGGYITRRYGDPASGVQALQLEMTMRAYLDESRPEIYDATRAAPLIAVLERLVQCLLDWRPS